MSKRNELNSWALGIDHFFDKFHKFDEGLEQVMAVEEQGSFLDRIKKQDQAGEELENCLDDFDKEFDEIEKLMKECGLGSDDE